MLTSPDGLRIWECMKTGVIKPSKLFVLMPNKNNIITLQFSSVFTKHIVENPDLKTWVLWTDPNHQQPVWFKSDPHRLGVFNSPPYRNVRNMLRRRGLVVLWFAGVMARADDEACAVQTALRKDKIHDNYVYFEKPVHNPVQSVQFDETSHSISDGQPYGGVFTLGYYLDVKAGRHETAEVAQYFNAGITPDNALGLDTKLDPDPPLPSELNFAISGNLSVAMDINTTGVCTEMKIAQGHRPTVNNWWIAGTKCYHNSATAGLTCPCGNYNVTFSEPFPPVADVFYVQFAWKVKTSNLVACSWQPTTCLLSARKIRVTWIFHLLEARLCPSVSRPESLLEGGP